MVNNKVWRVGLVGAGLQGRRRASVLKRFPDIELVMVASAHLKEAKRFAENCGAEATDRWEDVIERDDIDAVMVCTPPHLHAPISISAMNHGKHVLCEKPLARTLSEAEEMVRVERDSGVILKCGFNHRHHPGMEKAKEWFDEGRIGEINFIRCRYGICGRPGYEKEWRANPKIVGGGHLMEQGIHAVDLFRWFLGDFHEVVGYTGTYFWDMTPLEDNAFALFRTGKGQVATLHSSLTQWKNLFSLEIFGQDGYILVEGLGGSYGNERITIERRDLTSPFKEEVTEFRSADSSWYEEWKEFMSAIEENRKPLGSVEDGLEAMRLVDAVYRSAANHCVVKL